MSLIQAENLTKVYGTGDTAVVALDHVRLTVNPGEFVAVMGPSGCGKSTLLHLIGGLDRPTEGSVSIDGQPLAKMSDNATTQLRRRKIGFVFQFFNLIPTMTAIENLELPMIVAGMTETECRRRAEALLQIVGLEAKGNKRPEELSGGEQQRVGVALALGNDPALILADEPTGNLDSENAGIIVKLLCSLTSDYGKTVIMVSHDQKAVANFPSEYAMRDGRFVPLASELQQGVRTSSMGNR